MTQYSDVDGRLYYTSAIDPDIVFNELEITLSHLFRERTDVLRDRTYGECIAQFLQSKECWRSSVIEVGAGLGDMATSLLDMAKTRELCIDNYQIVDISPALLKRQHSRLGTSVSRYHHCDCLQLSSIFPRFSGLLLCNAVMADLRSAYCTPEDVSSGRIFIEEQLRPFVTRWIKEHGQTFIHFGALTLLQELHTCLMEDSTAFLLEFAATPLNQPALFHDPLTNTVHTKCGVNFEQLAAFARELAFDASVFPIETVLGIDCCQEFLSIDVFTNPKTVCSKAPLASQFLSTNARLPVRAYTRQSLAVRIREHSVSCDDFIVEELLEQLHPFFASIHDPRFDSTNPQTWGYRCLLLRKRRT